jgi:hypothetical protein
VRDTSSPRIRLREALLAAIVLVLTWGELIIMEIGDPPFPWYMRLLLLGSAALSVLATALLPFRRATSFKAVLATAFFLWLTYFALAWTTPWSELSFWP